MSINSPGSVQPFNLEKWASAYFEMALKMQRIIAEWVSSDRVKADEALLKMMGHVSEYFWEYFECIKKNPTKVLMAQTRCFTRIMEITQHFTLASLGHENHLNELFPVSDKRFKNAAWNTEPVFIAIKLIYFAIAEFMQSCVSDVEGLSEQSSRQVIFYTQQLIDALSPTNFILTNPEVLEQTLESNGANIIAGLNNMLDDLKNNPGHFFIKMTDTSAFQIGGNVATTPGKVIYQNDMIQLIQYTPTTEKVGAIPLLIIPPWINKYYILDLRQESSFVKFCIDQGHTVFLISWVNPTKAHANKRFDDYLLEGPIAAIHIIEMVTHQKKINALGFCIGGTLLGATAAYLSAKKELVLNSISFLTTLLDFSIPGDLGVFVAKHQLAELDKQFEKQGYLPGHTMRTIFNLLRPNDLIWNYYVNNYLQGKSPAAFDLLFWNGDSTNLAAKAHQFYLHNMYEKNLLAVPDGISLDNTPINLQKIKTPAYFISTELDHIAPWLGTYKGAVLLGGKTRFVLGGSGHIAGIVNPPTKQKYGYRTNAKLPPSAQEWLSGSESHEGSWWRDWQSWIAPFMGEHVNARDPEKGPIPALEDAPGSYVKVTL